MRHNKNSSECTNVRTYGCTIPPFFGTRIIDDIPLEKIEPFINKEILFASRWQFRAKLSIEEWEKVRGGKASPLYERLMAMCRAQAIIKPKLIYGYFECSKDEKALIIKGERKKYRFEFPREINSPNRCLADFFPDNFIAMQLATVGSGVVEKAKEQFKKQAYSETFFLRGLAAEATEATAAYGHSHIRRELGVPADQGERFSPGYPSFPDLFAQRKIMALLGGSRIGVSLTETCQLIPEYSTTAIISIDPKATHFRP